MANLPPKVFVSSRLPGRPVNAAPVVKAAPVLAYESWQSVSLLDPQLALRDPDSTSLTGATVTISGNYHPGEDVLTWTNAGRIRGSFNASTGTLKFSGRGSVADYQQALRSVGYVDKLASPSMEPRTIVIDVQDNARANSHGTASITVAFQSAPVVTTPAAPQAFTERGPAVNLAPTLSVMDFGGTTLTGARVAITSGFDTTDELRLGIDSPPIHASYNPSSGVLLLSGAASVAQYQAALRSITFSSGEANPSLHKSITWTVTDGTHESAAAFTAVDVTPVNSAPLAAASAPTYHAEGMTAFRIAPDAEVHDADSTNFNGGTLFISHVYDAPSGDVITVCNEGSLAGQVGFAGNVVTYGGEPIGTTMGGHAGADLIINFTSDAATPEAVQAVLRAVAYGNDTAAPSSLSRVFLISVSDGDGGGASFDTHVTVNATNEAPGVTIPDGSLAAASGQLLPVAGLAVSDPDGGSPDVQLQLLIEANHGVVSFVGWLDFPVGETHMLGMNGALGGLNAAISHLAYQSDAGYVGGDTITITVTDELGATDQQQIQLDVLAGVGLVGVQQITGG